MLFFYFRMYNTVLHGGHLQRYGLRHICNQSCISDIRTCKRYQIYGKCCILLDVTGLYYFSKFDILDFITRGSVIIAWSLFFQKLQLAPNSLIFDLWKKPPMDVFLKVYIFNITNTEEFLQGGVRLKVEEIGPYVYQ